MKGQSGIAAIIGMALIVIGIIFVFIGVSTITSPISRAINQTASTFPTYIVGALSADVSGVILILIGMGLAFIGGLILKASS